jgi:hypothetical protein
LGCLGILTGCQRCGPWESVNEDTPWIAPGVLAKSERRFCEPPPFVIAGGGHEYVWIGPDGRRHETWSEFGYPAETYLAANGQSLSWQPIDKGVNGTKQSRTPYRLTLVSVLPTVVLLTPHEYGPIVSLAFDDLLGPRPKTSFPLGATEPYPLNDLGIGIRAPYAPTMLWFSPDLNQPPASVLVQGGVRAEILLPDGRLVMERDGDHWRVSRVGRADSAPRGRGG